MPYKDTANRAKYNRAYYEQNKERKRAAARVLEELNAEATAARKRAAHEANRDSALLVMRQYITERHEWHIARCRAYYERNKEAILARRRAKREAVRCLQKKK